MATRSAARILLAWMALAPLSCTTTTDTPPQARPDADRSLVQAAPATGLRADGVDRTTVTITVRAADGTPIPGAEVQVFATGRGNLLALPGAPTDSSGVATASLASRVAERKTVTASASLHGVTVTLAASAVVEFTASGAAAALAFTAAPASAVQGAVFQPAPAVEVRDASGVRVRGAQERVTLALEGCAAVLSGTLAVDAVDGVAAFPQVRAAPAAAACTLVASAEGLAAARTAAFNVMPEAGLQLVFTAVPSLAQAGTVLPAVTVAVEDAAGTRQPVALTVTLSVDQGPAGAQLSGTTVVTSVDGVATFSALSLDTPGSGYRLRARASGAADAVSAPFSVTDAAPPRLRFMVAPTSAVAGAVLSPAVEVAIEDAQGQRLTGSTTPVSLAVTAAPGVLTGTTTRAAAGGVARFDDVALTRAGTGLVLHATAAGLVAADSGALEVTPGAHAGFRLEAPPSSVAGVALDILVTAVDLWGNTVPTFEGALLFTSTDVAATLPLGARMDTVDLGAHAFLGETVLRTAGGQELLVESGGLTGRAALRVAPAPAAALQFSALPSSAEVRQAWAPAPSVRALDRFGNVATDYAADVLLALASNPAGGVLGGTLARTPVEGVAEFPGLAVDAEGSGYTLRATGAGVTEAVSGAVTVTDTTAPAPAGGFGVVAAGPTWLQLQWTAPGDDGALGRAAAYQLYLRATPITSADYTTATAVSGLPAPGTAGAAEQFRVQGLASATLHHVALRVLDGVGNASFIAASGTTAACPQGYAGSACDQCATGFHDDGSGACVDACRAPNPCTAAPQPACVGNGAVTHSSPGSCALAGGAPGFTCTYASSTQDCTAAGLLCVQGACITDPCAGFTCTPAAPECAADGVTRVTHAASCVPDGPGLRHCADTPSSTPCGGGAVCFQGSCVVARPPAAGDLLVTELMHRPTATDGAYLELFNRTTALLDLAGTTLESPTNGTAHVIPSSPPVLVAPGALFVLGASTDSARNGGAAVNAAWGSFRMPNTGVVRLRRNTTVVEQLTWDATFPQAAGSATQLSRLAWEVRAHQHAWYWCLSTATLPAGDRGTPGAPNGDCGMTPGTAVAACSVRPPGAVGPVDAGEAVVLGVRVTSGSVTDRSLTENDDYPHLEAQAGAGTGTDATAGWSWADADFNAAWVTSGSQDELVAGLLPPRAGNLAWGYRVRLRDPVSGAPGAWTHCGPSGVVAAETGPWGSLEVRPVPAPRAGPWVAGATMLVDGPGVTDATGVTVGGVPVPATVVGTSLAVGPLPDSVGSGALPLVVSAGTAASAPVGVTVVRLLINELDCDQPGTGDAQEYVEISSGAPGVDLMGFALVFFNGSAVGDTAYRALDLAGTTGADGLLLVGSVNVLPAPGLVLGTSTSSTDLIQNGADAVALYQGRAADFSAGTAPGAAGLIDALVYDTAQADDATLLAALLGTGAQAAQVNEKPGGVDGLSIRRCAPERLDGRAFVAGTPSPGALNACP